MVNRNEWRRDRSTAKVSTPTDGTNIAEKELTYETRVVTLEIGAEEAHWFKVVVQDHDASNPVPVDYVRLPADGEVRKKRDLEEPLYEFGASREIVVQPITNVSSGDVGVRFVLYEHKA